MAEITARQLTNLLSGQELRIRTGILELPIDLIGRERDLAVELNVGHSDLCSWKIELMLPGRTRIGLWWEGLANDIARLVSDVSFPGYCIWISALDVFLSGIPHPDRARFWQFMRLNFRPPRGLLLSIPAGAKHLLPETERSAWLEIGRLAQWNKADINEVPNNEFSDYTR